MSASVSAFQGEPLAGKIRSYHSQMRHNMSDRKATYRSRLELLGESAEGSKAHHSALKTLERVPLFRGDADLAAGRHVYSARLLAPHRMIPFLHFGPLSIPTFGLMVAVAIRDVAGED